MAGRLLRSKLILLTCVESRHADFSFGPDIRCLCPILLAIYVTFAVEMSCCQTPLSRTATPFRNQGMLLEGLPLVPLVPQSRRRPAQYNRQMVPA